MTRTTRVLDLGEIKTLIAWATGEGWNPGLYDAVAFQAADPSGFIGAFVGDAMVAAISAVAYDSHFGFIGLYICHPAWRGQGHGKAVWDAGMAYLGDRTIGLDGVPEQQANYASMGFIPAYQSVRLSGVLPPAVGQVPAGDFQAMGQVDRACFPARRDGFLRHWLSAPNTALQQDGYAVQRDCREGTKIGPLFARDIDAALALLKGFEGPVQLDVPLAQTAFVVILEGMGFTRSFSTTRMYRGPAPAVAAEQVFAVTSLELG